MAVITFLFSFLVRQTNNIIQAIFGWSVSALFGKLPRRPQVLVTAALVISLAWPLFVLGSFMPRLTTWVIAFVPMHTLVGTLLWRIIWLTLALLSPLVVGALIHIATPTHRVGWLRAMVQGYPIALGFFGAFLTVAITVPIIKIASLARRWSDEHVYIQPHDGHYDDVIQALAQAVERAGLTPVISDVPKHLALATTIMRKFASGAVAPFLSQNLKRVTATNLEIYLYPADLLVRGSTQVVAHVRSMFGRTKLDAFAYLVSSPQSKTVQDDLGRLAEGLEDHGELSHARAELLIAHLSSAYLEIMSIDLPYDDWVILETMAKRVERQLIGAGAVNPRDLPLDRIGDHRAHATNHDNQRRPVGNGSPPAPHGAARK